MEDGLYSVRLKGFDGLELPPGGVLVLQNGMMLGGGAYTYLTGSYTAKNGIFKGELVLNQHTPPPSNHVLFNATDISIGISGSYEGDRAELTGTALIGKRSLTLQITLLRLADLQGVPHARAPDKPGQTKPAPTPTS
jgi:T3SS negative regulator,GrlR